MSYLEAMKEHKQVYIILMSLISVVIITNEALQFLEEIKNLNVIAYLLLIILGALGLIYK